MSIYMRFNFHFFFIKDTQPHRTSLRYDNDDNEKYKS